MNQSYTFSGTLSPNSSTYIARQADRELYRRLADHQFCYVFNSRKMGKSSLRVRVMSSLQRSGFACAAIDLSLDDVHSATPERWYFGMIYNLIQDLQPEIDLIEWWDCLGSLSPLAKLRQFIETVLLAQLDRNIVIFIDEIDSVLSLGFPTDDFFAFIRGCYNFRADNSDYNRLCFCLLGVATPSALIEDRNRTPFNIGHSIELTGFTLKEAMPLTTGLVEAVNDPNQTLAEIIYWTGGQPFLTQKLCYLVANSSKSNPKVSKLVKECIIDNWEYQDEPEHLKTIRDRLFNDPNQVGALLEIYQRILNNQPVEVNDTPEVLQLKLSGLVVNCQNNLRVYNPIYARVFHHQWVENKLAELRPYSKKLFAWFASGCLDDAQLLSLQELHEAQIWAASKSLGVQDYQFLNASLDLQRKTAQKDAQRILKTAKKQVKRQKIIGILFTLAALIAGTWASWQILDLRRQKYADLQKRISVGEDILLNPNLDKRAGAKQFALGNFLEAAQSFQRSRQDFPQDPETLIYINNARFANLNPITIAASVPIGKNKAVAQQMLRGIAQAQYSANQACRTNQPQQDSCGINGRPLQVKIVNDDNDPETAWELARVLIKDQSILAVIGHNASDVSRSAAKIYQNHLVMISPTSSAMNFYNIKSSSSPNNYIYRTVPSARYNVENLAEHIAKDVKQPKILICYDSEADDNIPFKQEFGGFALPIKRVDLDCDFSNPNLDYNKIIQQAIEQKANSLLLAPHIDRINEAIKIAKVNHEQTPEKKLRLFSSPSLYTSQTLEEEKGREAVTGMQLPVAWHPNTDTNRFFNRKARKLWQSDLNYKIVTWRTAMSYDATLVAIKGLLKQQTPTRSGLQKTLSASEFALNGATGLIKFNQGERIGEKAFLVEVQRSQNQLTEVDFVPLTD